jgi:large repetitive protein
LPSAVRLPSTLALESRFDVVAAPTMLVDAGLSKHVTALHGHALHEVTLHPAHPVSHSKPAHTASSSSHHASDEFLNLAKSAPRRGKHAVLHHAVPVHKQLLSDTLSGSGGSGGSDSITVSLAPPGDQDNKDGDLVSAGLSATDSASNPVIYSASGLPAGLSIDSTTGAISGTITSGDSKTSPFSVTATATDSVDSSATSSQTFTWTVHPSVSVTSPGDQTNNEKDIVGLRISAIDSAGNALAYSASGLPTGLSVNTTTGLISGTISKGASASSPDSVTVTATDAVDSSATDQQTFNWTVHPLVTVAKPGDQDNKDGDTASVGVSATDSAGNAMTYSAAGLPSGLSIDSSSGAITGTISDGASVSSPDSVTVTATDNIDSAATASQTFTWTVHPVVKVTSPGDQDNKDGDSANVSVSATDTGNPLAYSASGLPGGLSIDSNSGVISGTLAKGDSKTSSYSVQVTATDSVDTSATDNKTFTWTVHPVVSMTQPSDQDNKEGDSANVSVSATDTGNPLVYSASGLPGGLSIDSSSGVISGTITNGDSKTSPYTVQVTATDSIDSSATANQTFTWTVHPLVTVTNPGGQDNKDGDTVSMGVSANDSAGNNLTYSASGLPAGLNIDPDTGLISGTIISGASASSPDLATVTATDNVDSSATASQTFTWTVHDAPVITSWGDSWKFFGGQIVNITITAIYAAKSLFVKSIFAYNFAWNANPIRVTSRTNSGP